MQNGMRIIPTPQIHVFNIISAILDDLSEILRSDLRALKLFKMSRMEINSSCVRNGYIFSGLNFPLKEFVVGSKYRQLLCTFARSDDDQLLLCEMESVRGLLALLLRDASECDLSEESAKLVAGVKTSAAFERSDR